MIIKVKKLFNNQVSIRDYLVKSAIRQDVPLIVKFKKEYMTLLPEELKKGTKTGQFHQSQWGDKSYELIDFIWNPGQEKLL